MPTIQLGYGQSKIDFDYDDARFEVLAPNQANAHSLSDTEINAALDAPIDCPSLADQIVTGDTVLIVVSDATRATGSAQIRSEEHTSELQSRFDLVCRLLLEKKN